MEPAVPARVAAVAVLLAPAAARAHGPSAGDGLLLVLVAVGLGCLAVAGVALAGLGTALKAPGGRWCRRLAWANGALAALSLAGVPLTGGGPDSWKLVPVAVILGAIAVYGLRAARA